MPSKRSKVHPKYKTKYRVRNWSVYDRSLVARGDLTVWITPEALGAWQPQPTGRRGAQPKYSDLAIETVLMLRMMFHLPLRQAEGFLRSILRIMGLDLESPDHTTLSRRGQSLPLDLRALPRRGPIHLLIDSSGLSAYGEGEWAAAKHGAKGRRGWRKLHLSVDMRGVILAQRLTALVHESYGLRPGLSIARHPNGSPSNVVEAIEGPPQVQDEVPREELVRLRPLTRSPRRHHPEDQA